METARLNLLVALCLSDGGIGRTAGTRYIHFTNQSDVLLNLFKREIRKFSKAKIHEQHKERGITLRVFDKNLVSKMLKISPSFRTKSCENFPKCICPCHKNNDACHECVNINGRRWPHVKIHKSFFRNKKQICSFLQVYASCDGYASLFPRPRSWSKVERIVAIVCQHPFLKQQLSDLLTRIGIEHKIKKDGLFMRSKSSITLFKKKVGFYPGVKMTGNSKYWKGVTKNRVLGIILQSYDKNINIPQRFD
ncbi:MAG: LAGLIDADG family homing endonuclease [Candidatus Woesearchaeota archaeon]